MSTEDDEARAATRPAPAPGRRGSPPKGVHRCIPSVPRRCRRRILAAGTAVIHPVTPEMMDEAAHKAAQLADDVAHHVVPYRARGRSPPAARRQDAAGPGDQEHAGAGRHGAPAPEGAAPRGGPSEQAAPEEAVSEELVDTARRGLPSRSPSDADVRTLVATAETVRRRGARRRRLRRGEPWPRHGPTAAGTPPVRRRRGPGPIQRRPARHGAGQPGGDRRALRRRWRGAVPARGRGDQHRPYAPPLRRPDGAGPRARRLAQKLTFARLRPRPPPRATPSPRRPETRALRPRSPGPRGLDFRRVCFYGSPPHARRAAIAQLVRALDCGSRGPPFEPGWRYQCIFGRFPSPPWLTVPRSVLDGLNAGPHATIQSPSATAGGRPVATELDAPDAVRVGISRGTPERPSRDGHRDR